PNLPKTDVEEATREVCQSRDMIADQLGRPVAQFSYPNGRGAAHMNDTVREIVRRAGFRSAATSLPGCVQLGADPWGLRRAAINNVLGLVLLALPAWNFRQHRDLWYVTDPFMRVLLVIGIIFIFGTVVSWYTLPDHWVEDPLTKPAWGAIKTTQTDFTGRFMF